MGNTSDLETVSLSHLSPLVDENYSELLVGYLPTNPEEENKENREKSIINLAPIPQHIHPKYQPNPAKCLDQAFVRATTTDNGNDNR